MPMTFTRGYVLALCLVYALFLYASLLAGGGWNALEYFRLSPFYLIGLFIVAGLIGSLPKNVTVGWIPLALCAAAGVFMILTTTKGCGDAGHCVVAWKILPSTYDVYLGAIPLIAVILFTVYLKIRNAKKKK